MILTTRKFIGEIATVVVAIAHERFIHADAVTTEVPLSATRGLCWAGDGKLVGVVGAVEESVALVRQRDALVYAVAFELFTRTVGVHCRTILPHNQTFSPELCTISVH